MEQNHINPCFCISLRSGANIASAYDIIYGIAYMFRFRYLQYLHDSFFEYFPEDIPNPTKNVFMFFMSCWGNYISYIISGIVMLITINYLRHLFMWLAGICYFWISFRILVNVNLCIFCNALMESKQDHFRRFGWEVLFNIFMNIYLILVIAVFIRETRIELNNYRAIKPINIARNEHEEYLRNDKESKFNNATSYHYLSPGFYLNVRKNLEDQAEVRATYKLRDSHVDDTLLQYVITNSKVGVTSEEEEETRSEMEPSTEQSMVTLRPKPGASTSTKFMTGESMSYIPSDMSAFPDRDDGGVVSEQSFYDKHMLSRSRSQAGMKNRSPDLATRSENVTSKNQQDSRKDGEGKQGTTTWKTTSMTVDRSNGGTGNMQTPEIEVENLGIRSAVESSVNPKQVPHTNASKLTIKK